MSDGEAAEEEKFGDVAKAELVTQPPEDGVQDDISGVLEVVEHRTGAFVEATVAGAAPGAGVAERRGACRFAELGNDWAMRTRLQRASDDETYVLKLWLTRAYEWAGDVMARQLTAIIERQGEGYVALCPEVDVASQGATVAEARDNLQEAVELFFESASPDEVRHRLRSEVYVTHLEVATG